MRQTRVYQHVQQPIHFCTDRNRQSRQTNISSPFYKQNQKLAHGNGKIDRVACSERRSAMNLIDIAHAHKPGTRKQIVRNTNRDWNAWTSGSNRHVRECYNRGPDRDRKAHISHEAVSDAHAFWSGEYCLSNFRTNHIRSVPSEISNLKNLEALYLNDNMLGVLPTAMLDLTALTYLLCFE